MSSRPALKFAQPRIQWVPAALFPGVKLTTHLQLVPRTRKSGSIHPLPHMPSWPSTGSTLPFYSPITEELYPLDRDVQFRSNAQRMRRMYSSWRCEFDDTCGRGSVMKEGGAKTDPSLCIPALRASLKIRDANSRHCLHGLGTVLPVLVSGILFPASRYSWSSSDRCYPRPTNLRPFCLHVPVYLAILPTSRSVHSYPGIRLLYSL
jgi:hypothetical protein